MTEPRTDPPGARESSAGDEFHVLWAVRRALAMLEPGTALRRVVMEGISPVDPASRSPALLQGADLTEYYGGETFDSSGRVVATQLKYSERSPEKRWTAARLAQKGSRGQPGIIARLSEIYRAFRAAHDRDEVLARLRLRLVSNQPAHRKLQDLIAEAHRRLQADSRPMNLARLLHGLAAEQKKDLLRLHVASRLSKREFTDFLRLLNLDDLGADERWRQEAQIVLTLGRHLLDGAAGGAHELFHLVFKQALPEARGSLGLTSEDVLVHLGVAGWEALFPMPARFTLPASVIATPDVELLAAALLERDGGIVVAHGDAGVGKTTTVATLETALPQGSAVVVYDCFGGGEYLSAAETRHLVKPAVLQIINEIALRCGTPLLLRVPDLEALMWQHLEEVLRQAGESMATIGGRLVVAIDAADNAVVAGRERSQPSFIPDLLTVRLPPGVSLLVTCRSHRIESLRAPGETAHVELRGFDECASTTHLRGRFPHASDEACLAFHERSTGNPRSQFYVLNPSRPAPVTTADEAADQAIVTPAEIFDDLVHAAVEHAADRERAHKQLADLLCLTRPVELEVFAGATGLSVEDAELFCRGLVPGVRLENSTVAFRDEDFETYLRAQVSDENTTAAHRRLADFFLARHAVDAQAAVSVAEHLRLAGRDEELIGLAIEAGQPEAVADPVTRVQTYFRRLELAMQVAERPEWRPSALRLTVLAARAARTDQAVATVVRSRPDLAMRHGDRRAVARIYEAGHSEPWRGPLHLRVAALYARLDDPAAAVDQMLLAEAWIRRWMALNPQERYGWDLEAEDVSAGAQAVYWLQGAAAAREWLARWRPLEFALDAAERVVADVARLQPAETVFNELARLALPSWVEARMLAALFAVGRAPPTARVRHVADALLTDPPHEPGRRAAWTAEFIELVAAVTRDTDLVLRLLEGFGPPLPEHPPHEWEGLGDWSGPLRLHCMKATCERREFEIDDLLPPNLKDDAPQPEAHREGELQQERRRRLKSVLERHSPVLLVRARALLRRPSRDEVAKPIRQELKHRAEAARDRWHRGDASYRPWARAASEALVAADGEAAGLLSAIADLAPDATRSSGMQVWLSLADLLLPDERYHELALGLLDRVVSVTEASEEPAGDRADRLLRVAGLVDPYNAELAADYYRRAIVAAEGLDDEGAGLLAVDARLGRLCALAGDARQPQLAERLARAVERFRPFVSDPQRLPWEMTAAGVASLHPPAGLALLSRWEDEDRLALEVGVEHILPPVVDQGFLPPETALALLRLAGEDWFPASTALQLLEPLRRHGAPARSRLGEALRQLFLLVRRDLLPETRLRAARTVSIWAQRHGLQAMPGGQELLELAHFADGLNRPRDSAETGFVDSCDRESRTGSLIELARHDHPADLKERLEELAELWPNAQEIEQYLTRFGAGVAPDQRVVALQALADLPADGRLWRFQAEALLRALNCWLSEWLGAGPVRSWAEQHLPRLLRDRFVNFVAYEQIADVTLPLVMALPGLADPGTLLVEAAGPHLARLRADQLHMVAAALATSLTPEQQVDALEWSLAQLEEDAPAAAPELPQDAPCAVADLLWALFGHPDKRVRWRAAHAGRQLLAAPDTNTATELLERLDRRDAGPFVGNDQEFLWMSAQLWLLVLLARTADETPNCLTGQAERLADLALDPGWPHAAMRELARRAALRLDEHAGHRLDSEVRESLLVLNRPVACHIERGRHWRLRTGNGSRKDARFRFDSMDTLPYWYGPLGNVFALDVDEIAERAERWILDRLYYTDQADDDGSSRRADRYDYGDTDHRHGSPPRVERLRTYLEYHAMLLVAGELVAERRPVSVDTYDDPEDPWMSWLARHLDASPHGWTVDVRQPAPVLPQSYGMLGLREEWRRRSPKDFDEELGLSPAGGSAIVVDSYCEVSNAELYGYSFVASALVTPEAADAMLRALQTCKDPTDFRLPEEKLGYVDDVEIDEPGFQLLGWVLERRDEEDGLEEHDPLRRIGLRFSSPGRAFTRHHELLEVDGGRKFESTDGRAVSWVDVWSDWPPSERGYERPSYSSGRRTWVTLPELLGFLVAREMDLIVEVCIKRQYAEKANVDKDDRYEPGESRIYLLRQDGALETMDGRRQLR